MCPTERSQQSVVGASTLEEAVARLESSNIGRLRHEVDEVESAGTWRKYGA
ncbi:MAG: hypothetical protein KDA69_00040 [Planctomycetaceae bacterium]|nr:hypothetical protein [Planctomycetaceae bacterium]MCA9042672.1 hypothetical protein [Planctomycetaceae bacterium]MCB9950246.1 hypothetical protein [Planctomycetaceae bacterium]